MLASTRILFTKQTSKALRLRSLGLSRRLKSAVASSEEAAVTSVGIGAPSKNQLWLVFCHAAVPMIGFGFTDQTVMIQAGNAIDCTLGVTFGLSTLAAAAIGQICSNATGVVFGGTVERIALALGLPSANLTQAQHMLPIVSRIRWAGGFFGVIFGCCLGLVNLLFIDTSRSLTLKSQACNNEEQEETRYSIEASNTARDDATMLTVKGPDVDGLLASMTTALFAKGASIVEIHAQHGHPNDTKNIEKGGVNDVFYVVKRDSGEAFDDDELEELAQGLLDSTRIPTL